MKVHEYQAKALLAPFGVAVPQGGMASSAEEANAGRESVNPACWRVHNTRVVRD